MSDPVEHSAPWRWRPDENGHTDLHLVDANGDTITLGDETLDEAPPFTRELIRLAPEMEALLRSIEWKADTRWEGGCCPSCNGRRDVGGPSGHFADCKLAALLAALDAARAVKP